MESTQTQTTTFDNIKQAVRDYKRKVLEIVATDMASIRNEFAKIYAVWRRAD